MSETATTLSPDTPPHVLSDWTQERCHELGLPCELGDNGLTVTVPAREDGLPDWKTFLQVCHELQGADGWVMEGAKPDGPQIMARYWDWFAHSGRLQKYCNCTTVINAVFGLLGSDLKRWPTRGRYKTKQAAFADLSRACVAYSRAGKQMSDNTTITVKNITLPGAEWGRIERQLAAAERLYERIKKIHADKRTVTQWEMDDILSDYANAKEQQ